MVPTIKISLLLQATFLLCRPTFSLPDRQLVVILLDGMRFDYMDFLPPGELKGFKYFVQTGVRAEYLETVFPSMSYPAWTTLQTGLFPESHNMLGNTMYDPSTGITIEVLSKGLPERWQDAEPFWVTVTKQGLRAATILWSSADVPFNGTLPEVADGYKGSKRSFSDKIKEVNRCLKNGFDLVMMYHEGLDAMGHEFGPATTQVKKELREVARGLQQLFTYIKKEGHARRVHVIIVSDHGMAPACKVPPLNLHDFIDENRTTVKVIKAGGVVVIYAKPGHSRELHSKLQKVPGYITRLREDIPEEFHFKRSKRAPDLLMYNTPLNGSTLYNASCIGGEHGLDPREPSMRGFFAAWGDSFADDGRVHPPLRLVDVYQLYAHVLRVQPRPHNGSWIKVRRLLRGRGRSSAHEGLRRLRTRDMVLWICCTALLIFNIYLQ